MSTPKFAETHNLVAFLEKPKESNGFEEIIDFLNTSSVQYALTVNPTIYTTCIEQFWTSSKAKTVNGERQIQALVDKKKVIITETSIRSDLKLDDAKGTDCLPTATIFVELERIGYENLTQKLTFYKAYFHPNGNFLSIPYCNALVLRLHPGMNLVALWHLLSYSRRKQKKDSGLTEPIPDKAINEEHVATPSCDPPESGDDRILKRRVKILEKIRKSRTPGFKRLRKVGSVSMVESSNDVSLDAQEDASKQGRKINDLDANAEVTLVDETQEMNDDNLMFDTDVLEEKEKEVAEKEVSVVDRVTTAGEVVTTANVKVTTANSPTTTIDELTLAQTLIEIKAAKPKAVISAATTTTITRPKAGRVVVQEPSEFKTTSSPLQASQLPYAKDKGKEKMVEPEKPLKKKDQITMDEEVARNLEAQLQAKLREEERISRLKEEKANIALLES
ncbi:hypothetical protein Tco_0540333 [Tanacetum coccineum]